MGKPDLDQSVWGQAIDEAFQKAEFAGNLTVAENLYDVWSKLTLFLVPTLGLMLLAVDSHITEGKPVLTGTLGAAWVFIGLCLNYQARQDSFQRDVAYMQNLNETES